MGKLLDEAFASASAAREMAEPPSQLDTQQLEGVYPGGYVRPEWQVLARAVASCPGATSAELGVTLGVSAGSIRNWRKQMEYQKYEMWVINRVYETGPQMLPVPHVSGRPSMSMPTSAASYAPVKAPRERIATLREEIGEYSVEMFDRLRDIVEHSSDEKLIVSVAQDVLDRAGHVPVRKVEKTTRGNFVMTAEALRMFNDRALESGEAPVVEGIVLRKEEKAS